MLLTLLFLHISAYVHMICFTKLCYFAVLVSIQNTSKKAHVWQILPLVEYLFSKANLTVKRDNTAVIKHQIAIETSKYLVLVGCQNNH